MPIIDAHTHVFPDKVVDAAMATLLEAYQAEPVVRPTVDNLLAHMDRSGVDYSVICPVATRPQQVDSINQWILSLPRERLIPFGALHPHHPDSESQIQTLLDAGIRGIKLQPFFQGFTLLEEATQRLMEQIGDRLFIIMHGGDEIVPQECVEPSPQRMAAFVDRHPYLRMCIAHLGGYMLWDEVERHLVGKPVYLDLSYTLHHAPQNQVRRIIARHGISRVLWGSDFPWQSQTEALEAIRHLGLPCGELDEVLGGNFLSAVQPELPANG